MLAHPVLSLAWAFWLALLCIPTAGAQPVFGRPESQPGGFILVAEDRSGLTSEASPLYLASNHGGWNPGNPAMKMSRRSDGRWQIEVPRPADGSAMQFKFTRGSWDLVEVGADLADIPNRTLGMVDVTALAPGERPVIELVVEKFADQRPDRIVRLGLDPYRTLKVSGTVRRLQVTGGAVEGSATVRDLLVWLPPGYDEPASAQRRYPVLYLHDGQNLFEQLPGVPGEWRCDETASELISQGKAAPFIIVGIPHGGPSRTSEYLPVPAIRGVEVRAGEHAAFLLHEVMPRVRRAFRVSELPAETFLGGASLGAVVSLYAAAENPGVFGGVLLESMPMLSGAEGEWRDYVRAIKPWPARVFIGMGGREAGDAHDQNVAYVAWAQEVHGWATNRGAEATLMIAPAAEHTEDAWAERFTAAVLFLLSGR